MKPGAISLLAAEAFLLVDVGIYFWQGHPWIAAGWAAGMYASWKFFVWSTQ